MLTHKEANRFANDWIVEQGLDGHFTAQVSCFDREAMAFYSSIWYVCAKIQDIGALAKAGQVGSIWTDVLTGEIVNHTPIEEMTSNARKVIKSKNGNIEN